MCTEPIAILISDPKKTFQFRNPAHLINCRCIILSWWQSQFGCSNHNWLLIFDWLEDFLQLNWQLLIIFTNVCIVMCSPTSNPPRDDYRPLSIPLSLRMYCKCKARPYIRSSVVSRKHRQILGPRVLRGAEQTLRLWIVVINRDSNFERLNSDMRI